MMDAAIELLELALLAAIGWRAFRNGRIADQTLSSYVDAQARIEGRYEEAKRLYEKGQRRLSEHIRAPIHRG